MTIASVKPFLPDTPGPSSAARSAPEPAVDFAAVARSVAAGDLDAARQAVAAGVTPASGTVQTLAETLGEGNLAAARLALAQLGAQPFAPATVVSAPPVHDVSGGPYLPPSAPGRDMTVDPSMPPPGPAVPGPSYGVPHTPENKAATVPVPNATPQANGAGLMIADVGSALAATPAATPAGETVRSVNGNAYSVADVMLALATGNAGSIPADVINLYGPGGARYDPAAIMDAYRDSSIGQAQMAMLSWVGRPA